MSKEKFDARFLKENQVQNKTSMYKRKNNYIILLNITKKKCRIQATYFP